MTTPHNNEALEVGQEISLFDCRWKIEGIHLGALGQESLIELKSLTHKAGWTGQWEYHPMVFVPEPFVRVALTRANQRASEAPPTAQGVEGFVLVPLEPTDTMIHAGMEALRLCAQPDTAIEYKNSKDETVYFSGCPSRQYRAMISAAPKTALTHPREQQREDEVIEGLDDALKNAKVFGAMEHLVGRTPPMIRCENRTPQSLFDTINSRFNFTLYAADKERKD